MQTAGPAGPAGLSRRLVLAAIVLTTVVFAPGWLDPFGLPKVALLWVCAALALAALLASCALGRTSIAWPRLAIPAAVLLAVTGAATAFSIAPVQSFRGMHPCYNG